MLVLDGETVVICGSRRFHLTPGCFIYLPRGVPHAFNNRAPVRNVTIVAPGQAWEVQRAQMMAGREQGLSMDAVFAALTPDAHFEVLGPAEWGDDLPATAGP